MEKKKIDISLSNGSILRVEPITEYIFRIRLGKNSEFKEPSLIRYGILNSKWEPVEFSTQEQDLEITIQTSGAFLSVNKKTGRLILRDSEGNELLKEASDPRSSSETGFAAEFELKKDEKLYGLGDETRDRIQKRGHRTQMWVKNVACYVPIPFLTSTSGWGILLNTTWRHNFDLGRARTRRMMFWGDKGELDYYLIVGETLPKLLERYSDIAGKPHILPLWGYALTFVCNQQANAREMLDDCLNFRREDIPCDLVGLEPGWMEKNYDFTTQKKWHPERFYIPYWSPKGPHTFLGAAERLGFKMSLWLCCDYDLSIAEENEWVKKAEAEEESTGRHPDDFEKDEHFGPVSKPKEQESSPDEPWFEHLKKFIDQGASAFKMDGSNQVNEHPDRKWGNGMTDEEMHNLYPTLLNKQMSLGFKEYTGRRAMIYSSGGYTGIQQYAATWAGDTGGGPRPLVSMLNHGLSGHSNVSCDMDVFSPAGIHFGFLMTWSQVCSWAYWRHPWLLGEKLLPIFKFYARLRYRLLPYIYSMAHVASRTAMPVMRSMNLMFPDDPECENLMQQYMFGDFLLAAAFTDKVYLPEGLWIDFWTGEKYEGKKEITCPIPEDKVGLLFIRAGAIIPHWPDMDYVGQKQIETIGLHVYPHQKSQFTLYEDDGVTYDYLKGQVAITEIECIERDEGITLTINPRSGEYKEMPKTRLFEIWLHHDKSPKKVLVNGQILDSEEWRWDNQIVRLKLEEDRERKRPVIVDFLFSGK